MTIFAANYALLQDDPHNLLAGQQLVILPVDGVYRQWFPGEKISTVANYYHVTPKDIIDYPPNHLDRIRRISRPVRWSSYLTVYINITHRPGTAGYYAQ